MKTYTWTLVPLVMVGLGLALAGCSGNGGGSGLSQMAAQTRAAMQDVAPVGDEVGTVVDDTTLGLDENALGDDNALNGVVASAMTRMAPRDRDGSFTADANGLHFTGTWDVTTVPALSITGSCTVTGTLTGTGTTSDGTVVNLTHTANITSGAGTLTLVGDVTPAGGVLHHLDITRTITKNGTVLSIHTVATITKDGVTIYSKDVTRDFDLIAQPCPRTLVGTVTVNDDAGNMKSTITYNTLVFTPNVTDPMHPYREYNSGGVTVANGEGYSAVLTAQADLSLSGPVTLNGTPVGTMTIKEGTVTVSSL